MYKKILKRKSNNKLIKKQLIKFISIILFQFSSFFNFLLFFWDYYYLFLLISYNLWRTLKDIASWISLFLSCLVNKLCVQVILMNGNSFILYLFNNTFFYYYYLDPALALDPLSFTLSLIPKKLWAWENALNFQNWLFQFENNLNSN